LIGVQGYIKTPDHIYLVEQLSRSHGPLSGLEVPIQVGLAGKILDQLVSVVRDGLHEGGRVCHRDLKADNLLIDE
jgi:serine/threonine protein kinase